MNEDIANEPCVAHGDNARELTRAWCFGLKNLCSECLEKGGNIRGSFKILRKDFELIANSMGVF